MGNKACNPSRVVFMNARGLWFIFLSMVHHLSQQGNHVLSVSRLIKEGMKLAPHNLTSKFVIYRHFFWVLYFMAISVTREFIF